MAGTESVDMMQYQLMTLRRAIDDMKGSAFRSVVRTLGAAMLFAGIVILAVRWMNEQSVRKIETEMRTSLAITRPPPEVDEDRDENATARAALTAARAAMKAAERCRPKVSIKYLPTLDMQYETSQKRPLLGAYVLGDLFDHAGPHPTTDTVTTAGTGVAPTWKGLDASPSAIPGVNKPIVAVRADSRYPLGLPVRHA